LSEFYVVVDDLKDWAPYYPSSDIITFEQYRTLSPTHRNKRTRVVNLCRSYKYLSRGYYTSLLAEARGHHVFPSVSVLNDLSRKMLYLLQLEDLENLFDKTLNGISNSDTRFQFNSYFGQAENHQLNLLSKKLFERFSSPILQITLIKRNSWQLDKVKTLNLRQLNEQQQNHFAQAFEHFSCKLWRKPKAQKKYRYDLAILVDEKEKLPPSNKTALKRMAKAARAQGMDVELIDRSDFYRLAEFDALFIRETTAIDNHTYRFAKKAELEGMVVIDDSRSIMRCTNKVYLTDLFSNNNVPIPKTVILSSRSQKELITCAQILGFPMVLKIPDGSFSRGVTKVNDLKALQKETTQLMGRSALLIAQEFMYTDYDWRIGILNNKPLYACRYFMVSNHWQIYQHGNKTISSGGFETLATFEVPKKVLNAAVKATRLIGNSLYGVDLKQKDDRAVVIEVNDNPNIDAGVEDKYLGHALYDELMAEIIRRIEIKDR
jgi:glutathione synthase/RimK-type ligase-like ATP-grasp enzyme